MSKERLEEMEELLNEYYKNIDDPFASTDNAMAIVDKVGYFVNRVQELEEENEVMFTTLNKLSNRDTYSMIDGQMRGQATDTIKQILRLRRNRNE